MGQITKYIIFFVSFSVLYIIPTVTSQCLTANDNEHVITNKAKNNLYLGEQAFTLSLLRAINTSSIENAFFSPYSTYQTLLLAYFGSNGNTQKELEEALNLGWAKNKFEVMSGFRLEETLRMQRAKNSSVTFRSTNKIYVSKEANLRYYNCFFFNCY